MARDVKVLDERLSNGREFYAVEEGATINDVLDMHVAKGHADLRSKDRVIKLNRVEPAQGLNTVIDFTGDNIPVISSTLTNIKGNIEGDE